MEDFELFWKHYPKKVAKADARKAWLQTKGVRPDVSTIIKSVTDNCRTEAWTKSGGQFIPHASTWLRGERWEDELTVSLPETPWHETASGIEAKGRELGLDPSQFDHWQAFKVAVMQKSLKAA